MAISNSFHSSAKTHAIKNASKLASVQRHNQRGYLSLSHDDDRIKDLIGDSSSITADVKRYIDDTFSQSIEMYNEKQKRNDRKIKSSAFDYFCDNNSLDIAVESILQIADKNFWDKYRTDTIVAKSKRGNDIIKHEFDDRVINVMNDIYKKQAEAYESIYITHKEEILKKVENAYNSSKQFLDNFDKDKKKEYENILKIKNKTEKTKAIDSLSSIKRKELREYLEVKEELKNIEKLKLIDRINNNQMHIKLLNLTAHYDENSPHAHAISVCWSENYKTGLSSRVAKSVVLNKYSLEIIQERMNEIAKEEINKHPELFEKESIKDKEKGRAFNYTTEQYINNQIKDKTEKFKNLSLENENLKKQNELLLNENKKLLQDKKKYEKFIDDYVIEIENRLNVIDKKIKETDKIIDNIEHFEDSQAANWVAQFIESVKKRLNSLRKDGKKVEGLNIPTHTLESLERALEPFLKLKEKVKEIVEEFSSLKDLMSEAKKIAHTKNVKNRNENYKKHKQKDDHSL